ncbi:DUF2335 domain-containing protein [Microvirga sp. KLBC 81]|uniref:DUF2335 domain-containing protein n=1 Tax=Microvirga sp. KLBC 81 TaxID=1862707 RepID=UPI0014026BAA|nr:DUF2335 domain-containing protein [Microvirga sp. KLBC 81]
MSKTKRNTPVRRDNADEHQVAKLEIKQVQQHWSGPLPDPETLAAFDQIVPGGAARIFDQFEKEADHRRALERSQTRFVIRDTHIGQALAGTFALAGLSVAAFAIYAGAQWAATIIGGSVLVPIVYAFLKQTWKAN